MFPVSGEQPDETALHGYIPDNSQLELMNRTLKDAVVKRCHYACHDELRQHLQLLVEAHI